MRGGRTATIRPVAKKNRESILQLDPDTAYMVNCGSVGQPRDGDWRAAYAIFDSEAKSVALRRVEYPVEKTAEEIIEAGLPEVLAARLYRGL